MSRTIPAFIAINTRGWALATAERFAGMGLGAVRKRRHAARCSDAALDILPGVNAGDSSVEGMMPHTENTECSLISPGYRYPGGTTYRQQIGRNEGF